jgi:hypothetical protein
MLFKEIIDVYSKNHMKHIWRDIVRGTERALLNKLQINNAIW